MSTEQGRVTFKSGTPGLKCGDCDAVFTEDSAGTSREAVISEARGAREVRGATFLSCPCCGGEDLEDCELCFRCEEAEATDAGQCASCNPALPEDEEFRRDLTQPVLPLVRP